MAKKKTFTTHTDEDLTKFVHDKREELRALRFNIAGSKNRNVKLSKTLRHEVARAMTEVSARKNSSTATKK